MLLSTGAPVGLRVDRRSTGSVIHMMRYFMLLFLFVLTSCSASPSRELLTPTPSPGSTSASTTSTPVPAQSTESEVPTPQSTRTLDPCTSGKGTMTSLRIRDPRLIRDLEFQVFLPPCYYENKNTRYPTLYLLHGLNQTGEQWDHLGIDETALHLFESDEIQPMIIVMPWERTGLDMESALVEVLLPYIEGRYRTCVDPNCRAIGGISRGGGLALQIVLQYANLFGSLGMHSPAVIHSESWLAYRLKSTPLDQLPRIWIDIGRKDSLRSPAQKLLDLLDNFEVPYSWHLSDGEHNDEYWSSQLESYLRWYNEGWLAFPVDETGTPIQSHPSGLIE